LDPGGFEARVEGKWIAILKSAEGLGGEGLRRGGRKLGRFVW